MRSKAQEAHFLGKYLAQCASRDTFKTVETIPPPEKEKPYVRELNGLCHAHDIATPVLEFRFAPPRRWRFDAAWPHHHIALEIEGGVWTNGRHTRPQGFINDIEKYNTATVRGWRVIRTLPGKLADAIADVKALMERAA